MMPSDVGPADTASQDLGVGLDMGMADVGPADSGQLDQGVMDMGSAGGGPDVGTADLGLADVGAGLDSCQRALGLSCSEFEEAYVKASNTDGEDEFGFSVALSGDTLAVGASYEDSAATGINGAQTNTGASDSGAVYVFTRSRAGVWSQQAYLKASNTNGGDRFGYSVALSGDTLAVGARGEGSAATGINGDQTDNSAWDPGAVYVFTRSSAGIWSQQAYLKASNTDGGDQFGHSVTLYQDTLAVAAPFEDSAATGINGDQTNNGAWNSGAVYIFTRSSGGAWSQQAYLKASNTGGWDWFGHSVALYQDTLAVAAPLEASAAMGINGDQTDNNAGGSGAVYVFTRSPAGVWSQQVYLKASNTDEGDQFGFSLALYEDTLAVGALGEASAASAINGDQTDNSAEESGAVYVFTRSTAGAWFQEAYLKASNTDRFDRFGHSVALDEDTLAVGALGEASTATGVNGDQTNNSASDAGAVYLFSRSFAGIWAHQAYLKASNTDEGDHFGVSIALDENTLAVGASEEESAVTGIDEDQTNNEATQSGAAYVRRIAP